MAVEKMSSLPFTPSRIKQRTSDKIIFIVCEGSVTEWEYFENVVNSAFEKVKSKIKVINILEDALRKPAKRRTTTEAKLVSSSHPLNLVNKMDEFKRDNENVYDFTTHSEDEFWLIMDVDDHTDPTIIDKEQKSNLDKWNEAITACKKRSYSYAVSNPFFELWLLLHHDKVNTNPDDENNDAKWAVTANHAYEPTDHFKERLSALGVGLHDKKHIKTEHYNKEKVLVAMGRAKELDTEPPVDYPTDLGTTVYRLLKKIEEIDSQY